MENLFNRKLIFQNFSKLNTNQTIQNNIATSLIEDLQTYLIFFPIKQTPSPSINLLTNPISKQEALNENNFNILKNISTNIKTITFQKNDQTNISNLQDLPTHNITIALNCLHNVNFLTHYLKAIKQTLSSQGTFCGNFYGTNTLQQLKDIVIKNESTFSNKIHQRFNPTMSIQSVTALLQNSGFIHINVYTETTSLSFPSFKIATQFLKSINERLYINHNNTLPPKQTFQKNLQSNITLDFEIIKFYCQAS